MMNYISTRDILNSCKSAEVIINGIANDGGLFVPEKLPSLDRMDLNQLSTLSTNERAVKVLHSFLTDWTEEELKYCVDNAYTKAKFDTANIAPLYDIDDNTFVLELWHGPTCAFKDMALQILPYLLSGSIKKTGEEKTVLILVATSGDTGKAALEGFRDVEGTKIAVFYPSDGVSNMQKLQMVSQEGENVAVYAIKGNFDDAQNGVKKIFVDREFEKYAADHNVLLSSANSINWGRLVPQIVYYVSAYCDLIKYDKIKVGDKVNVVVPTGNFGNILAAYYARKMGVPFGKLICASNTNKILTDFISTGIYDRNRDFHTTISPSMDILISSNLERLLFDLSGNNAEYIKGLMNDLSTTGKYIVTEEIRQKISDIFYADWCSEEDTIQTIHNTFKDKAYLCDTHTAVGVKVYNDYVKRTMDETTTLIVSTANPYKFPNSVYEAVSGVTAKSDDDFEIIKALSEATLTTPPNSIVALKNKRVRFDGVISVDEMKKAVQDLM